MIHKALEFISSTLDHFLENQFSLKETKVIVNRIINADGTIPSENENKMVLTVVNITEGPDLKSNPMIKAGTATQTGRNSYQLSVLISSNFSNYAESLKFLDTAVHFFQTTAVFNAASFSDFPAEINNLHIDLYPASNEETHHIWTSTGAKYQPSVVFRVRVIL
jgi:hypothetical protein